MNKSSFLYWYPRIEGKINTPKSVIISLTKGNANSILDGDTTKKEEIFNYILSTLSSNEIYFPVFMKTDHYSAKWYWDKTCFIKSKEHLLKNILFLLECSEDDEEIYHPLEALVFREFIKIKSNFKAFNNMPIGKERRYFIDRGVVLCHHPYWEEDSIEFFNEDYPTNWKKLLEDTNYESKDEIKLLTKFSESFAALINDPGYFSVDFAQTEDGDWWVIDSAEGHKSYHNEDCEIFKSRC